MAFLGELGKKYPVLEQGEELDIEDEVTEMAAGDILEVWYDVEGGDLNRALVRECIHETLFMKEEYPYFVLHHMRFESRRVYVQFSVAPVGQGLNPEADTFSIAAFPVVAVPIVKLIKWLIVLIGVILAASLLSLAAYRGIILRRPPPVGSVLIWAKNMETGLPLPNVKITCGDKEGTTGPDGAGVLFDNLLVGNYTFFGETVPGYHPPDPVSGPVQENLQTTLFLQYFLEDQPKPTHGWLVVYTHPVIGGVFIGGVSHGPAPVGPIELLAGDYSIGFSPVDGWKMPQPQVVTVPRDDTVATTGIYSSLKGEENWWEKYVRYALIGGGVILGAALIVPEVIRGITRRSDQ